MATKTTYEPAKKAEIMAAAKKTTVAQAAKDHGVSEQTIYAWRSRERKGKKKARRKASKKAARRAQAQHTNGVPRVTPGGVRVTPHGFDVVESQLTTALDSLRKMREAYRTVFGGP